MEAMNPDRKIYRVGLVLISSLIPALGLIYLNWKAFDVALTLWLDGAVKLVFAALQVFFLPRSFFERCKIAIILSVFFGGFMAAHLAFLLAMLLPDVSAAPMQQHLLDLATTWTWPLVLLAVVVSYWLHFVNVYLARKEQRLDITALTYRELQVRVIFVQLVVLLMGFLVHEKGANPTSGLLLGIAAKTASDLFFEWKRLQLETPEAVTS